MKFFTFVLLYIVCAVNVTLFAQTTSSSLSGRITDKNGEVLPGATVSLVHKPTNRQLGALTNADGRYNFVNLTPGGPYELTITFVSFKAEKRENIYLQLGEKQKIDFILQDESTQLEEVKVISSAGQAKIGAAIGVSKEQIQTLPTLSRSFSDFTRLTPQSSNNSFAGTNFRYNNITLDGAINNDAIGFSPSLGGLSGTANQPGSSTRSNSFSLDAVQEVQVQIAPYDVSIGNFTGGSVNAVSRSGSNEVTGSVYAFGRSSAITGHYKGSDRVNDGKISSAYHDYQTGFRIGFPIIKDKLFFFTNEEIARNQVPQFFPAGSPNYFMSQATADAIRNKLITNYGYDPGATGDYSIYANSNKFFNRIDWNITSKHQLALRNNTVISEATNLERGSSEFQFGNYDFVQKNTNISTVAELKSRFSNLISNNLIIGYTDIKDRRNPVGIIFPQIQINNVGSDPTTTGSGTVLLGTNREAGIFNMRQQTFEITDNFKWFLGNHSLTFGTHNELYSIKYNFINSWNGRYDYNSVQQFLNDQPARLRAIYSLSGDNSRDYNLNNSPAHYKVNMFSLYAQDEFTINSRFTLTYGLRADMTTVPNTPPTDAHAIFPDAYTSSVLDTQTGTTTTGNPTYTFGHTVSSISNKYFGQVYISPRIGFNYDVKGNQSIVLRGGSGIFTGRIPFAWLGYSYVNNGVNFGAFDAQPTYSGSFTSLPLTGQTSSGQSYSLLNPTTFPSVNSSIAPGLNARRELDIFDKNFKLPRMWRSNLAIDFNLPQGYKLTLEAIYTKTLQDMMIKQINLKDSVYYAAYDIEKQQPLYLQGGSTGGRVSNNFSSVYLITNTTKGYRYQLTAQIQKAYQFGLNISAAYTYGQSKDILNGIRNSPESGWQLNQNLNPNNPQLTYSNFDIRHRIVATVNYKKAWSEKLTSYISFIFTAESGSPFTWVIGSNNLTRNGQQIDLAYIPKTSDFSPSEGTGSFKMVDIKNSDGSVKVSAAQQWQDLNKFIDGNSYLSSRRGQFTERNGARTPWNNRLDVRLMQDFNFKAGTRKHTIQVSFDMINFTNLLSKTWGIVYFVPNTRSSSVNTGLTVTRSATNSSEPTYTFTTPTSTYSIDQFNSRFQGQLGLRYLF
ncbi:carboxypeptidase-like regulatory domain-containing protein [Xanthocytophaga agilis]|uniref:Carboxypeptidase-like regulatory domain-containing protein n=1 Tax=Xanthocytophaga agilis TaxID=3048010 RepID=A0AAE3R873_9BACT|nr:carboxypeptidase-like regulatory domain-containing protein [Xanthocytophaga agilis]MDJ1503229.1 carboxypeptidase-like regulatory domain-containing protein [Xanthocytophaga agilis]